MSNVLRNFTSPHAGRQLRADLGYLPALWAEEGDYVLVENTEEAEKAFGELFLHGCQDMQDIPLGQSVRLIMSLFADAMKNVAGLTDEQVEKVKDYVVSAMPGYLLRTLSLANGIRQAA